MHFYFESNSTVWQFYLLVALISTQMCMLWTLKNIPKILEELENDTLDFWLLGFIPLKISSDSYELSFISALWMVFSESWRWLCLNYDAHDCDKKNILLFWKFQPVYSSNFERNWKLASCLVNDVLPLTSCLSKMCQSILIILSFHTRIPLFQPKFFNQDKQTEAWRSGHHGCSENIAWGP